MRNFVKNSVQCDAIDHAGEVAECMMVLKLNKLGRAFLEMDKFVSQNNPYAGTRPKEK